MAITCYCKLGMMAQCVAKDLAEQQACWFSAQSANGKRCMYLNTNINHGCWDTAAHDFSEQYGVVRLEDIVMDEPETIYDESDELGLLVGDRRTCKSCLLYTSCPDLIDLANVSPAGVTDNDLWTKGTSCGSFLEESYIPINGGI
jgi:hypothetical protein